MHTALRIIADLFLSPPDIGLALYFAYQWLKEGVINL